MIKIDKRAKNKIKKKQKKKKESKDNIYKSTFDTISNIIFITIICSEENSYYISLHSLYFIVALTTTFSVWLLDLLWHYFFLKFVRVSFNFITQ